MSCCKSNNKTLNASAYCFCVVSCLVRRVSKKFGFREVPEDEEWNLFWIDYTVALDKVMEMKRYQVH